MPGPAETSARVKTLAAGLGFDACAIAAAAPVDPEDRLGDWLGQGFHADMAWLARTKSMRRNVGERLPGCRGVVVVARNYRTEPPPRPSGTGRVSRYAWGRDYHRVLRKPLRRLAGEIERLVPGAATSCCIDSGPVLEKFWAARAGLGWIGKNSLVLRRDLGSWFFLGVILTTAELAPNPTVPDFCGSCRACLDACPTGAIVEPRVVDSRRCISYQTIENRGHVPAELHAPTGDWVFGCDICQDVCPWNRKTPLTTEVDFLPRPGHAFPDLDELAGIGPDAFRERFAGSPIMRAKAEGMRRNARIARANVRAAPARHGMPVPKQSFPLVEQAGPRQRGSDPMLSDAQIQEFKQLGYLMGPQLVSDEQADVLRDRLFEVLEREADGGAELKRNLSEKTGRVVHQVVNIWEADDLFRDHIYNEDLCLMASQLMEHPVVRVWHDQIQYKPPKVGGATDWHQDHPYWPIIQPADLISAWMALEDATVENGCMWMVPGSHLWGPHKEGTIGTDPEGFDPTPDLAQLPECARIEKVPCEVKKGHVMFHHCLTWHGSPPNHSDRGRPAIAVHYMPGYTRYEPTRGHVMERRIEVQPGEELHGKYFPTVWDHGPVRAEAR